MKILPWLLLTAAVAALCFVWNDQQQLRQAVAKFHSQTEEVETLRAEIAELRNAAPASPEMDRLQKEVLEIHKLRNEVRQLRTENQGLSQKLQQQSTVTVINSDPQQPQLTLEQLRKENEQLRYENEEFHRARIQAQGNACINNLKQLDGATEQWALENKLGVGALPGWAELVGPDKYIRRQPVCPMGGQYTLHGVGERPTCTVPGHELPQ